MDFTMKGPCNDCPFLREGGIRLGDARILEIAGGMISSQGSTFQCHKTVTWDYDDEEGESPVQTEHDQHCAGALIFAIVNGNMTQMMRIAGRLGMFDAAALMANTAAVDRVFSSVEEMLATAI